MSMPVYIQQLTLFRISHTGKLEGITEHDNWENKTFWQTWNSTNKNKPSLTFVAFLWKLFLEAVSYMFTEYCHEWWHELCIFLTICSQSFNNYDISHSTDCKFVNEQPIKSIITLEKNDLNEWRTESTPPRGRLFNQRPWARPWFGEKRTERAQRGASELWLEAMGWQLWWVKSIRICGLTTWYLQLWWDVLKKDD